MNSQILLIDKAQKGDKLSEELLVKNNTPLVKSCIKKLVREGYPYEDLMQLGFIGLIKAIRRFDIGYNTAFSTYAVPLIMGEVRRYLRDDGMVKVSRIYKEGYIKIIKATEHLKKQLMREPDLNEISNYTGFEKDFIILATESSLGCESLDSPISDDNSLTLGDTIEQKKAEISVIDKIALKSAILKLDSRGRKIIILRYFFGKTQSEVSSLVGVSQVQVSRIEKKLIEKMRKHME